MGLAALASSSSQSSPSSSSSESTGSGAASSALAIGVVAAVAVGALLVAMVATIAVRRRRAANAVSVGVEPDDSTPEHWATAEAPAGMTEGVVHINGAFTDEAEVEMVDMAFPGAVSEEA